MSLIKKIFLVGYKVICKKLFGAKPKFIFVMGHMRSGSSLLSHLLLSNDQVLGLGERNACYNNDLDLWKLIFKCRLSENKLFSRASDTHYLDQINHNHMIPEFSVIAKQPVFFIFIIRNPSDAILSLLRLSKKYYGSKWTLRSATNYYIQRLKYMAEFIDAIKEIKKFIVISYEELVNNPDFTLSELSKRLGLKSALKPEYRSFSFTGIHGDPSGTIKEGRIIQKDRSHPEVQIEVHADALLYYERLLKFCAHQ